MAKQLTLGIGLRETANFDSFYIGDNLAAVSALTALLSGDGERLVYLWGEPGAGTTHLLQACCHAMPMSQTALYIDFHASDQCSPALLDSLDAVDLVCFDHIDAVVGQAEWEEAVFHCYNQRHARGARMVVAAPMAPAHLPLALADLQSRLTWGLTYQLKPLTDHQKHDALLHRAAQLGLVMPEAVSQYLLTHVSRDLTVLCGLLEPFAQATLTHQRRLTIPFVKSILEMTACE